jgi:beta-galactosidase/beta-glucuronidase
MTRGEWKNLNGLWNYAVVGDAAQEPAKWDGEILVPYPIESALSGVKMQIAPTDALVYERGFTVPASWNGRRLLLHFGAVDYRCEVLVNGRSAGKHEGGYDPFSFDITDLLNGSGEQKLVVKVADPTWTSR